MPDGSLEGGHWPAVDCGDPLGRPRVTVASYRRPDGVGVIRLPGFVDPSDTAEGTVLERLERLRGNVQDAFEAVKDAPALFWDVRGNQGGASLLALALARAIASGFPGAAPAALSFCNVRVPESLPPAFQPRAPLYALTPGGPFAYAGKVAVLIEGDDYSAADYFALAAKEKTAALLVGSPTAGGYGSPQLERSFDAPVALTVGIDNYKRSLTRDGLPLEGRSVTPRVAVEYEAADVAAGRDTVLERAVLELGRSALTRRGG